MQSAERRRMRKNGGITPVGFGTFVEERSEHVTPRVSDLNEWARPTYAWTPQVDAWHPDWACAGVGSKEEMG
jgi:hypothetical protein